LIALLWAVIYNWNTIPEGPTLGLRNDEKKHKIKKN
jgi:hypothetical protein